MKRQLKKLFGKLFLKKLKTTPGINKELAILEINDNTDVMHEALGITQKRTTELCDYCESAFKNNTNQLKTIMEVSKKCTHINEFYMCTVMLEAMIAKEKQKASFMQFFDSMFKK